MPAASTETVDFDANATGTLPPGWRAEGTNPRGPVASWRVIPDPTAPSPPNVLALASTNHESESTFNVCWTDRTRFRDGTVELSFKALSGKADQGGGPVWRVQDASNYYICRANPLEENFRVYVVRDGSRKQLGSANAKVSAGEWHSIRVEHRGDRIECWLGGKKLLDARDDSIPNAGGVGFWTKADAVTSFDDLRVSAEGNEKSESAPAVGAAIEGDAASGLRVFVVNTQDASVSLVDLDAKKEIRRIPVGERPYGVAVVRGGRALAVGVEGEEKVKFFDLSDFRVIGETKIGPMHNDHIVRTSDGRHVVVANYDSDDVVGIDAETMRQDFRISGASAPHVIKYGPLGKNAYVTCKKVTGIAIVDLDARKVLRFHPTNVNPRSLTFSPDESRLYFGSFWVDEFFEMDPTSGKITRLLRLDPPAGNSEPQEVTYHGVEFVGQDRVLAANEGRSVLDCVDVRTGKLLDRLGDVSRPCCVERIPGTRGDAVRALVSNLGDATVQAVEVDSSGKLRSLGKIPVGSAPKRVAFLVPESRAEGPAGRR